MNCSGNRSYRSYRSSVRDMQLLILNKYNSTIVHCSTRCSGSVQMRVSFASISTKPSRATRRTSFPVRLRRRGRLIRNPLASRLFSPAQGRCFICFVFLLVSSRFFYYYFFVCVFSCVVLCVVLCCAVLVCCACVVCCLVFFCPSTFVSRVSPSCETTAWVRSVLPPFPARRHRVMQTFMKTDRDTDAVCRVRPTDTSIPAVDRTRRSCDIGSLARFTLPRPA